MGFEMIPVRACVFSCFSCVQLFVALWATAHQSPLLMGFSRQEYWTALSFLTPGDLPNPGMTLASLMSPALAGEFFNTSTTWEAPGTVCVQSLQSRPTLGNPMDCSPPGSSVHGIFQARILEWVAISFSRGSSQPRD